jgi:hypothetical protein
MRVLRPADAARLFQEAAKRSPSLLSGVFQQESDLSIFAGACVAAGLGLGRDESDREQVILAGLSLIGVPDRLTAARRLMDFEWARFRELGYRWIEKLLTNLEKLLTNLEKLSRSHDPQLREAALGRLKEWNENYDLNCTRQAYWLRQLP